MNMKSLLGQFFAILVFLLFSLSVKAAEEFKISGQEANAYYGKFIYGEKIVPKAKNKFWNYLTVERFISLEQGKKASAALFLIKDGTYTFRYTEGPSTGAGSFSYDSSKDVMDINGKWRVVGSNLELDGFATATGVQIGTTDVNGKQITVDGIAFSSSKNIRAPGFAGKVLVMIPTLSTHSMDGKYIPID